MKLQPLALALVHHPVLDRRGDEVAAAVTNLDIHDLARLAKSYGLARYYLVTPLIEQQALVRRIVAHWRQGFGADYNSDRSAALDLLQLTDSLDLAEADWQQRVGRQSRTLLTGARHAAGLDFSAARTLATESPLLLVFGTGHGLAPAVYRPGREPLAPLRAGGYNHLSVRTAAAIILDRLVGEGVPAGLPDPQEAAPMQDVPE